MNVHAIHPCLIAEMEIFWFPRKPSFRGIGNDTLYSPLDNDMNEELSLLIKEKKEFDIVEYREKISNILTSSTL